MLRGRNTVSWIIAGTLVVLAVALLVNRIVFSPEGVIIFQDPRAPWIMAPQPVTGILQQWGHKDAPQTRFSTSFSLTEVPASAILKLRAFGEPNVYLNGKALSIHRAEPRNWKRTMKTEVAGALHPGSNIIEVVVKNALGPALLSLRLEGHGLQVATGEGWMSQLGKGLPAHSIIATDTRPLPGSETGERTVASLASKAPVLLSLFAVSAIVFFFFRHRLDLTKGSYMPTVLLIGVGAAWVFLFLSKFILIDLRLGYDAEGHLSYVDFLHWQRRIPLATEGWEMYQPPLFYLLAWMVAELQISAGIRAHGIPLMKIIPFLAGLGNVWLSMRLCRRLFPERTGLSLYAIAFAGLLPVNIYIAAYFSNESFHAFLFGCCILVTADILLDKEVRLSKTLLLSVLLGLATLTKFTAAIIVAFAGLFITIKCLTTYRAKPRELLLRLAALSIPALLISGWFYARNIVRFGTPFAANWGKGLSDTDPHDWWSYPGFHTPDYYLSFGASLVQPYFSCFHSFWDALYSTFWGDGEVAGQASLFWRHAFWDYEYMAAVYLLAVPASVILLAGWVRTARLALSGEDPDRRSAFGFLVLLPCALLFSTLYLTLQLPFFGIAKASYSLGALPAFALFFAYGADGLGRWMPGRGWGIPGILFFGWLGTFLATCYLAFAA